MTILLLQDKLLEYKDSKGILPAGLKLKLLSVMKETTGEYSCAAANSEGETRSRAIPIRVQCELLHYFTNSKYVQYTAS